MNADAVVDENVAGRLFGTLNSVIVNKGAKWFIHGKV